MAKFCCVDGVDSSRYPSGKTEQFLQRQNRWQGWVAVQLDLVSATEHKVAKTQDCRAQQGTG